MKTVEDFIHEYADPYKKAVEFAAIAVWLDDDSGAAHYANVAIELLTRGYHKTTQRTAHQIVNGLGISAGSGDLSHPPAPPPNKGEGRMKEPSPKLLELIANALELEDRGEQIRMIYELIFKCEQEEKDRCVRVCQQAGVDRQIINDLESGIDIIVATG